MKSVGIDIGSSHIKVVEALSTSKGFQILSYQIHVLNRLTDSDKEIEVIEFLRDLSTRYDTATTRFNLAITQDKVSIRNKIFPFNDRLKINKSLAFELEEDIPFSSDSATFDAKIVQYHGNATEVLACAVQNQHIKNLLQLASDGSISPNLVSAEGTTLANIFERWNEPPPQQPAIEIDMDGNAPLRERPISILLNIGHSRTLVCAFEGNLLVGVRSILWGANQIINDIAKKYNLPPKEAQKEMEAKAFILHTKQEATYEAKIFSDLIAKNIRDLARDLQLVLLEFRAEFNGQIQRIDMIGGPSMIQGLGPFLTQLLEVPANRLPVLNHFPNVLFEKNDATQSQLAVAMGLAIEGLRKPRNPAVNFLKGDFAKQSNFIRVFWHNWGPSVRWAAAALVVLFMWSVTRSYFADQMNTEARANLRQQAKNVAGLTGRSSTESRIRSHIRESSQKAQDLRKITSLAKMNSAMEVLKKINDATPANKTIKLDVRIFNIVDSGVVIEGYLGSNSELGIVQKALSNVALGGQVQSRRSSLPAWKNRVPFAMVFNVDRNTGERVE